MVAWPSMREVHSTRQVPGEPQRRWFASPELDLIVWCDAAGAPVSFQLCYDKGHNERALTWDPSTGLRHSIVDDGESLIDFRYKATPVLTPDGERDRQRVVARFVEASGDLPGDIAAFVRERLAD